MFWLLFYSRLKTEGERTKSKILSLFYTFLFVNNLGNISSLISHCIVCDRNTQSVLQMNGFRSLGDNEEVEFECKASDKGLEATRVTGVEGNECKGSDRRPMSTKTKKIRWVISILWLQNFTSSRAKHRVCGMNENEFIIKTHPYSDQATMKDMLIREKES